MRLRKDRSYPDFHRSIIGAIILAAELKLVSVNHFVPVNCKLTGSSNEHKALTNAK